jgi:hypothetical protein
MEILFYYSLADETGKDILQMMENMSNQVRVRLFRNWKIFSEELKGPRTEKTIAVVLISQREELLNVVSIRDLIHEFRLVLILPDSDENTVSLGHSLRPNFIAYRMGDLRELEIVLKKMLRLE